MDSDSANSELNKINEAMISVTEIASATRETENFSLNNLRFFSIFRRSIIIPKSRLGGLMRELCLFVNMDFCI